MTNEGSKGRRFMCTVTGEATQAEVGWVNIMLRAFSITCTIMCIHNT